MTSSALTPCLLASLARSATRVRSPADSDRPLPDDGASASPEIDQSLFPQLGVGAQNGVHVHSEGGGQIPGSRQTFTSDDIAVGQGTAQTRRELGVERKSALWIETKQHCASYYRTTLLQGQAPDRQEEGSATLPMNRICPVSVS